MAKAKGRISKNSSIPESPLTSTGPAPTGTPNDLTLDEVLEQMLPHYDDDPFEVAKWVNDHLNKKSGLVLCGDGVPIPPHLCATDLIVVAQTTPNGQPVLEVSTDLRRLIKDASGELSKDERGMPVIGPIKLWTVDRKSFEANRPDAPRNRGGRPDKYPHMRIMTEALIYIAVSGVPATLDGEGGLFEKLELVLKPNEIPGRGTLYKIFNPIWKRIEDERKRVENERKKSQKKLPNN